ncbi:MAG: Lrp/AsnC family transcriptional regulator [Gemmatimonas sp.]
MNGSNTRQQRSPALQLDEYDRAILRILQQNNRMPQRSIAEQVHLSSAAVHRRIAAMEANGVIQANVARVNLDVFHPAITIIVDVHLRNDRSTIVNPINKLFQSIPEIQQCDYVTGAGGFILVMIVPDMTSYEELSTRLFADNESVDTYRTLVVLDRVKTDTAIPIPDLAQ